MWSIVVFSSRILVIQYLGVNHLDHPLCHCIALWPELSYWPMPDTPPLALYLKVVSCTVGHSQIPFLPQALSTIGAGTLYGLAACHCVHVSQYPITVTPMVVCILQEL